MKAHILLAAISFLLFLTGCQSTNHTTAMKSSKQNSPREIQKIGDNTFKVYAAADYYAYSFDAEKQFTDDSLKTYRFNFRDANFNRTSTLGTASLLSMSNGEMIFLTCFHIFNYPDTIKQYYYRSDGSKSPFLSAVAIKKSQTNFTKPNGNHIPLDIIASDTANDIILLSGNTANEQLLLRNIEGIAYNDIPDGSESLISGYPGGYHMYTKALVSKQKKSKKIMLDAPFNKGYSGAPFYVYHPESQRYLLAGIITSTALNTNNVLVPEFQRHLKKYHPDIPYQGKLYVASVEQIKYGITFTATTDEIDRFIRDNRDLFLQKDLKMPTLLD